MRLHSTGVRLFGLDPEDDRLRIRALRATPPGRAAGDEQRRQEFAAALGQFDELLTAAENVGPASRPLPLYYAVNQAGRAIAAALQLADREWQPRSHGLSISDPDPTWVGETTISPQRARRGQTIPNDSFSILAEAINAPPLTAPTTIANVWAAIPGLERPGLGGGRPQARLLETDLMSPNPVFAHLRGLPGLPPTEESRQQLEAALKRDYPQGGDALKVHSLQEIGSPIDGPTAELHCESPDGSHLPITTAADRYLGSRSGCWLIPKINATGDVLPPVLLWWCLLHALSHVARYHPAAWTAALDPDGSPEAVPIERTLSLALAAVPRLVLLVLRPGAFGT